MIQIPSVYNQPSVYNGGGGAPGDFGTPGASILPVGYRQVAAVYIPNRSNSNIAKVLFYFSDYNIPNIDSNAMSIFGAYYRPKPYIYEGGNPIELYHIQGGSPTKHVVTGIYSYSKTNNKIYAQNGDYQSPSYSCSNFEGLFDVELNENNLYLNGQIISNAISFVGTNVFDRMDPFCHGVGAYTVATSDIATRYIKVYGLNNLLLFFIPCVRESDGVCGLFDLVRNFFVANAAAKAIEKIEL